MKPLFVEKLTKRADFLFVQKGRRVARPTLTVEARRRAEDGPVRLGFTASRRVGGSVARNRARRRLREAARQLLPELAVAGVDYVIVARQSAPDAPWTGLLDDLRNALIRLRAELEAGDRPATVRRRTRKPSASDTDE
jgi:ribonuclease P protein component